MNQTFKTVLWLVALLVAVVLVSFLYSRTVQRGSDAGAAAQGIAVPLALPDSLHPDLQAGLEALDANDPAAAVAHLSKVPADDPGYLLALQRLGVAEIQAGDVEASLQAFREYSALRPDDPEAHRLRARAYFRVGQFDRAETAALRAVELDPRDLQARYDLGLFRLVQGRLGEAISAYTRAMRMDTDSSAAAAALAELEGVHAERPDFADLHYALAFFAGSMENHELEKTELEHYLALQPQGPAAENARSKLEGLQAGSD